MTTDIFLTITNMTTFNSFMISLPFLMVLYSNLFYFIMFHEGSKLLTINEDDDSDNEDTTETDPDKKVSSNIKFNKDYETKYIDKLKNEKIEYNYTEDEIVLLNAKVAEFRNEAEHTDSKTKDSLIPDILKKAEDFVISIRSEKLLNSYILESTPLGNVVMRYNFKIEAFEFFSDNTIPYRYLETVSRKYVLTHKCVYLYVDMAQTLRDGEVKLAEQKEKDRVEKENDLANKKDTKKNVFANLKNYNKPSFSSGSVKNAPPPKNNISNVRVTDDKPIILKEKANRYSCQGKLANFSFLKKVDKKLVNKKMGLSFADFKYMDVNNTKILK